MPWEPAHPLHQQNYGDNVYHYQEDHLSLYLYFYYLFLVNKKDDATDLSRTPDLNEHHQTFGDFDQQHYSGFITDMRYLLGSLFGESY